HLRSFITQKLKGRIGLQKIIANTSWLFFERVLRMVVVLFVGAWLARYLGPDQYGLLNYSQAMVALAISIAKLGLDNIVVRNIVRNIENRDKILGTAFVMKVLSSIISIMGIITTTVILRPDDTYTAVLVAIISIGTLLQTFDVIDYWFQSQEQSKFVVLSRSTAFIVTSFIKIFLIANNADLIYFGFAISLEFLISGMLLVVVYKKQNLDLFNWSFDLKIMEQLLKDSWPLILSAMSVIIYMKVDQIMLGIFLNDSAVGIYTAATKLSEAWYFIPTALMVSFAPTISRSFNNGNYYDYLKKIQTLMNIVASIALVISILVTFIAPMVISILYGDGYLESATV
ncbi:flippase, partial [Bacillaceae bacterium Marseille-Q3522]|nr:flippase [Bacillaceae bacterium Marseille-Q3522]